MIPITWAGESHIHQNLFGKLTIITFKEFSMQHHQSLYLGFF
jgi:hypothetical protein